MDLNSEWMKFIETSEKIDNTAQPSCSSRYDYSKNHNVGSKIENTKIDELNTTSLKTPKCSELYISTKTMIGYLDSPVNLIDTFWKIPVIAYGDLKEGVIKKQIKFNSTSKEEVDTILTNCNDYTYVNNYVMQHIDNPEGRIKFKDVRKVTIGLSKKDIISYRIKQKSAFYNCFVIIIRVLLEESIFKEFHVKVFNTGKLELPGIRSNKELKLVYNKIYEILGLRVSNIEPETVLINSNFSCGYYIKRDVLYGLLKNKYNISTMYDPCSYPGIQCKLYIASNNEVITTNNEVTYKYISFMIFRTGSVLIVGKCNEYVLNNTYKFIVDILQNEYNVIMDRNSTGQIKTPIIKKKKKRTILFETQT